MFVGGEDNVSSEIDTKWAAKHLPNLIKYELIRNFTHKDFHYD